jgi:galactokinase
MQRHASLSQLSVSEQAIANFNRLFDAAKPPLVVTAPGRVNLIGEHIDYHGLPVMPMAIQKQIAVGFLPRKDRLIRAKSGQMAAAVDFTLTPPFVICEAGNWGNYLRAAARTCATYDTLQTGIDAYIASDLPSAAGLSSSSALLIAFSLALLKANGIQATLNELTALLPDGEQFVGTRGGAMDHVAILASRAGFATLIRSFSPLAITYVPIPQNWRFLVAHSLIHAEKSGAVRALYNARREAGTRALQRLGFESYGEVVGRAVQTDISVLTDEPERNAFLHVTSEARRVDQSAAALRERDLAAFGRILYDSHMSLRDRLQVSLRELDLLVDTAMDAGAAGARLTGAGFGGCVLCVCSEERVEVVRTALIERFYAKRGSFEPDKHLFLADPSSGALA